LSFGGRAGVAGLHWIVRRGSVVSVVRRNLSSNLGSDPVAPYRSGRNLPGVGGAFNGGNDLLQNAVEQHRLSEAITEAYEETRERVAAFLNAHEAREIVFLRGTTESINALSLSFERSLLKPGDEIVLSTLEHHANIVPWQIACQTTGATIKVAPITPGGQIDLEQFAALLSPRTKLVAVSHVSNALGTIQPIPQIVALAHAQGIPVLVDGAQAVPHLPVDVQELDCDFYIGSGHKMGGPTGAGYFYGRAEWMERLTPHEGGADMTEIVRFDAPPQYAAPPKRFEAGTPALVEVIGMGEAVDYWGSLGMTHIAAYEQDLMRYAADLLRQTPGVKLYGDVPETISVVAFNIEGREAKEVERRLDREAGVIVRAGDLNAQPLMRFLGVPGLVRASFLFYNTAEEAEALATAVARIAAH
jgi:cysteine desulfurase/selenocysteine lyase